MIKEKENVYGEATQTGTDVMTQAGQDQQKMSSAPEKVSADLGIPLLATEENAFRHAAFIASSISSCLSFS